MSWLLLPFLAQAGVPDTVRPVAAPPDAPAQYELWATSQGRRGDSLVCRPLWPDQALICYRVTEGDERRWVAASDLAQWGVDADTLHRVVGERAVKALGDQPTRTEVDGMSAHYWVAAEGDGWAAAGLLRPEVLAERMGGGPILVAAPTGDALLAWRPGDAALDKVMAVGVRRMFEDEAGAVSPVVHRWTGDEWLEFGEAVPTDQGATPGP